MCPTKRNVPNKALVIRNVIAFLMRQKKKKNWMKKIY
jgi:hypothetical protein